MDELRYEAYDLPPERTVAGPLTREELMQLLRPEACGLTLEERARFLDAGFVVVLEGAGLPASVLERYGVLDPGRARKIQVDGPVLRLAGGAG
jgi:hypothetical protein